MIALLNPHSLYFLCASMAQLAARKSHNLNVASSSLAVRTFGSDSFLGSPEIVFLHFSHRMFDRQSIHGRFCFIWVGSEWWTQTWTKGIRTDDEKKWVWKTSSLLPRSMYFLRASMAQLKTRKSHYWHVQVSLLSPIVLFFVDKKMSSRSFTIAIRFLYIFQCIVNNLVLW